MGCNLSKCAPLFLYALESRDRFIVSHQTIAAAKISCIALMPHNVGRRYANRNS